MQYFHMDVGSREINTPHGTIRLSGGDVHDLMAEFNANKLYSGVWNGTCETCGQLVSECLDGSGPILEDARENARCPLCGDGKKLIFEFVKGE